jgi:hypothetical protein
MPPFVQEDQIAAPVDLVRTGQAFSTETRRVTIALSMQSDYVASDENRHLYGDAGDGGDAYFSRGDWI